MLNDDSVVSEFTEVLSKFNELWANTGGKKDGLIPRLKEIFESMKDCFESEGDENIFWNFSDFILPILKKSKKKAYYPTLAYMLAYSYYADGWYDEAVVYAEKYYDLHHDNEAAALLLAGLYGTFKKDKTKLERALCLIDEYLASGDPRQGLPVKIDTLINLKDFEQADRLLSDCTVRYPERNKKWTDLRIYYYEQKGEPEKAIEIIDKLLETEKDKYKRGGLYHRAFMLIRIKSEKKALQYTKDYIQKYPDDVFALLSLSGQLRDIDYNESILLLERAYRSDPQYSGVKYGLMKAYLNRAADTDSDKYFDIVNNELNSTSPQNFRFDASQIIYGRFGQYDKGQAIRLLQKSIDEEPRHECHHTLLGKAYEYGIGTEKNAQKAFGIYQNAYLNINDSCKCGMLFYAYALYFGIGTAADKYAAKDVILEMSIKRGEYDYDYGCLYAVAAFDNIGGLDRKKAMRLLKRHSATNASSAFLLFKYSKQEQKAGYWKQFVDLYKKADYLEQQHLKPYLDNPDAPFVPFIHN